MVCDEIYGCTNPLAPNFIAEANIETGHVKILFMDVLNRLLKIMMKMLILIGSCELIGCMAEGALNYSESATIDWRILEPVIQTTCNNRYLDILK